MVIKLKNISKTYFLTKENKVEALKPTDLEIQEGETVAIIGPSGSGKSTLLNLIGLLDRPDEDGELMINDHNIADLNGRELAKLRRETIGFVFQSFNLLPRLTALENVMLPMQYSGKKDIARAKKLLKQVGLESRMGHKPPELSGGEKQRVAIARALANEPKIILADEPTGNLDSKSGQEIMKILKDLDVTLILVTHDQNIAAQASRLISLKDGSVC